MPQEISNERLQQIAAKAAKKLPELIGEREADILPDFHAAVLPDFHAAVQDAHEDEDAKMPKLKLGFKLEYDLQTNALGLSLQWTVSRKASDVVQLEDPNQTQLPLEE